MKNIILFLLFPFLSFGQTNLHFITTSEVQTVTKSFMNFWRYYNDEIDLSEEYLSLDQSMNIISKKDFLSKLATGNFLPLRSVDKKVVYYKLNKLDTLLDNAIHKNLISIGELHYKYYQMEGTKLPSIITADLNGKSYSAETTKGKILVLKCWFINCQKCIEEIPYLNKLFDKYANRNEIIFLSLAIDNEVDLSRFLKKIKFNYGVVPNQRNYMENILKVEAYPTHIIVDKTNTIVKVLNDAKNIKPVLDKLFFQ
ncbi:MAG: TlpA family protein disulfide reductase [Sphingobacteriia bacterium]|nr:MAG: TlpA family protein disulfide reductase [Sphingobacteriia bacterium]